MGHHRIALGRTAGITATVTTVAVVALVRHRGHGRPQRHVRHDWSQFWAQAAAQPPTVGADATVDHVDWTTSVAAARRGRLPRVTLPPAPA